MVPDQIQSTQCASMTPMIVDWIRCEPRVALKVNQSPGDMVEVRCRACSGALPTHDPAPLRSHFTHITRAFFAIGSHSKSRAVIDMVIKARLSEMTLAWSKKTKASINCRCQKAHTRNCSSSRDRRMAAFSSLIRATQGDKG